MKIEYIEPPSNDIPARYHDLQPMQCFRWANHGGDEDLVYVKLCDAAYLWLCDKDWRYRHVAEGENPEVIAIGTLVGVTIEKD